MGKEVPKRENRDWSLPDVIVQLEFPSEVATRLRPDLIIYPMSAKRIVRWEFTCLCEERIPAAHEKLARDVCMLYWLSSWKADWERSWRYSDSSKTWSAIKPEKVMMGSSVANCQLYPNRSLSWRYLVIPEFLTSSISLRGVGWVWMCFSEAYV